MSPTIEVTQTVYDILIGLAENKQLKQVADELHITYSTARTHLNTLRRDTGLTTYRAVALAYHAHCKR